MQSLRISEIVNMLTPCKLLADIGCDHAYACIHAIREKKSESALACDINHGPLDRALENIHAAGLSDRITTVLSDGLKDVQKDPEAIIISGMGGLLIRDILAASPEKTEKAKQLILGPHSEISELRRYLTSLTGFFITSENVVKEQNKFYVLIKVEKGIERKEWSDTDLICGKPELQKNLVLYKEYLNHEKEKAEKALKSIGDTAGASAGSRRTELDSLFTKYRKIYDSIQI